MDNEFVKQDLSLEDEKNDMGNGFEAVSDDDLENESNPKQPPFIPKYIEPPPGATDGTGAGDKSRSWKPMMIGFGLIVLFMFVVFAVLMVKRSRPAEETISVSTNSNTSGLNDDPTNDEILRTIQQIAANSNSAPLATSSPATNTVLDPNGQSNPLSGIPVFDPSKPDVSGIRSTPNSDPNGGGTNSGGGFTSPAIKQPANNGNSTTTNDTTATVSRTSARQPGFEQNEPNFTEAGGGRNLQRSIFYGIRSASSDNRSDLGRTESLFKPPFGTMIPIRTLGKIHTLQPGGLVRMEIARTVQGNNYTIPRGTVFVGRVSGGASNRMFVSLIGYIEARSNSLIELKGDVLSGDGGLGLIGDKKSLHSRWKSVLGDVFNASRQLASSYLLGRKGGSGGGGGIVTVGDAQIQNLYNQQKNGNNDYFIVVEAGTTGFIMVNDLPPVRANVPTAPLTSEDETLLGANNLSENEMIALLTSGSPSDIRKNLSRMSPQWRELAEQALAESGNR